MSRVFSGVQPSGNLHLGNYLGAIRNFVPLQDEHDCIYCAVDMHAITQWQDPAELRDSTRELAAALLAVGLDPKRSIIFAQSQVPAHAELTWIFSCVARLGCVPIFIGTLAGGEGAVSLLGILLGVVFGPIGFALAALFTLTMLYRRFETVRRLVRRA